MGYDGIQAMLIAFHQIAVDLYASSYHRQAR